MVEVRHSNITTKLFLDVVLSLNSCDYVFTPLISAFTGAFLIPYFIFLFGGGLPVFFLEVALGQFTSEGGITCWEKLCPIFTGMLPLTKASVLN